MTLQDICVSLELAKELKENGYSQEGSLFYWGEYARPDYDNQYHLAYVDSYDFSDFPGNSGEFAAPTVSELGEKLLKIVYGNEVVNTGLLVSIGNNINNPDRLAEMYIYFKNVVKEGLIQ